jgi:hypothetical protein
MVMEYSPQFSSLIGATLGEEDEIMTRPCSSCSRVNKSRRAGIPANRLIPTIGRAPSSNPSECLTDALAFTPAFSAVNPEVQSIAGASNE